MAFLFVSLLFLLLLLLLLLFAVAVFVAILLFSLFYFAFQFERYVFFYFLLYFCFGICWFFSFVYYFIICCVQCWNFSLICSSVAKLNKIYQIMILVMVCAAFLYVNIVIFVFSVSFRMFSNCNVFILCSLSASNLTKHTHTQIYRTSTCKWTFFREMIAACLKNVKNRDPTDYHRWLDGNFGMRAHDKHVKKSMRRVFFLFSM